ncbi:hypothetical protein KCP75_04625 [Salmonella enterica subsp. enterica]|nr:hypothetical protein KCP75_04625 [Salmonella enterica subsp. enterica]
MGLGAVSRTEGKANYSVKHRYRRPSGKVVAYARRTVASIRSARASGH